jgi:prevent-host-death family protein
MTTMTAVEAKKRFRELLDRVARGEEIVITRHDKPVARIVPEGDRRMDDIRRSGSPRITRRDEAERCSNRYPTRRSRIQ